MNVYLLLDRSGSMSNLWVEAINSINSYVSKLKPKTQVYLALFDSESYEVVRDSTVKDWKELKPTEYTPRSMTPLYDACGKIMTKAELDNSKKTVLVVMTDGFENNSKEYKLSDIKTKIKNWEDKKWEVVFLGANFDQVSTLSGSLGVALAKSVNYSLGNFDRGMSMLASKTAEYGSKGSSMNFSAQEIKDLAK